MRLPTIGHADRPTTIVLPADPDWGDSGEPGPRIGGTLTWNRRGLPARASLHIVDGGGAPVHTGGKLDISGATVTSYPIIQHIDYLRDGLVGRVVYGDGDDFSPPVTIDGEPVDPSGVRPERRPTQSITEYDIRRRPFRMRTVREPTSVPEPDSPPTREGRPLSAVSTVVDQHLVWDEANNLTAQIDDRDGSEWPAGRRPQTVHVRHDALYRVVGAEYDYSQDDGSKTVSDEPTDWRQEMARTKPNDPMQTEPAAMVPELPEQRVVSLTWEYDWLSNMESWTDDAASVYERSIGDIGNGADYAGGTGEAPALRPSALYVSTQLDATSLSLGAGGWLELRYGVSGNVTSMTVHGQCSAATGACSDGSADDSDPAAERSRLRDACSCASEQHYVYRWDELNRLAEARRYDREAPERTWALGARLRYRYDGNNQRTVKEVHTEGEDGEPPPPDRIALYVYPGDFERRGLTRTEGSVGPEYQADSALLTETQYLLAGARVVWKPGAREVGLDREHRVTFNISDLLQTTTAVVDVTSGALVECSTYYPNGARESYLTNQGNVVQPEPKGFTGKEGDHEVGLVYFGERYLIPRVGRG